MTVTGPASGAAVILSYDQDRTTVRSCAPYCSGTRLG
ncbi:hypothetical protein ABIE67_003107 [Streptomyces sp. V4I8]